MAGIIGFSNALSYKGRIPNETNGDFNDIAHGIWEAYAVGGFANIPTNYKYGTLICIRQGLFASQIALPLNNNDGVYYRVKDGSQWYPWRTL